MFRFCKFNLRSFIFASYHKGLPHLPLRISSKHYLLNIYAPRELCRIERNSYRVSLQKQWSDFLIFTWAICVHLLDMFLSCSSFARFRCLQTRLGRNTPKDIKCKTMNNLSFPITRLLLFFSPSIRMHLNDIRAGLARSDGAWSTYIMHRSKRIF